MEKLCSFSNDTDVIEMSKFLHIVTCASVHWRNVALSTPLHIYVDTNTSDRAKSYYQPWTWLINCLSLSPQAPVSISLETPCAFQYFGDHYVRGIANCAHRWDEIRVENGVIFYYILKEIPSTRPMRIGPTPMLTDLSVSEIAKEGHTERDMAAFMSMAPPPIPSRKIVKPGVSISLQSAPSLTRLTLRKVPNPAERFENLPWSQITYLTVAGCEFSSGGLSRMLRYMPHLATLWLELEMTDEVFDPVRLPLLEYLEFDETNGDQVPLDLVTAPRPQALHLMSTTDFPTIEQFFLRSGCSLKELKLSDTEFTEEWGSFWGLKDLKKLHLICPFADYSWLRSDQPQQPAQAGLAVALPVPFQDLKSLIVVCRDIDTDIVLEDVISMVKSRLPPGGANNDNNSAVRYLASFTLSVEEVEEDEVIALDEFQQSDVARQSGVQGNIKYNTPDWDV